MSAPIPLSRTITANQQKAYSGGFTTRSNSPRENWSEVTSGRVFDVAVDIRKSSPWFGKWVGETLSAENKSMLWIPPGFAHGFYVLSDEAEFTYKCTDYYAPEHERSILWNDPEIAINWPIDTEPVLSPKDEKGLPFGSAEVFK